MRWRRACNPLGPGLRGLVTANAVTGSRVAHGAQSAFVLNAPPGTAFSRLRWSGHAQRRDCRYALQMYAVRPDGSDATIKNVRANRNCPKPEGAQASSWPRPRAYDLGGATKIVQRVVCVGASSGQFCSGRGLNYIQTFTAEATVVDSSGPSVNIVADTPLARGDWVRGKQGLNYEASDNVGVKSASANLAGLESAHDTRACDYSQRIPCPNGLGQVTAIETERVGGRHPAALCHGRRRRRQQHRLGGGNGADRQRRPRHGSGRRSKAAKPGETATTSTPLGKTPPNPTGRRSPRRTTGSAGPAAETASATLAAARRSHGSTTSTVPAPGEWELRLWREDAAGNQQPDNASAPAKLRFDPEPPQLGFEARSDADPTRVSVQVTDPLSGLGGGEVEISRVGSGTWQALPTSQDSSHLLTRIDDAALPAGEYELRATAHDQAGNLASTTQRLDGQPMKVKLPLRIASSIQAGAIEKKRVRKTVHHGGKSHKVTRTVTVLSPHTKVGFGHHVRLAGTLVDGSGNPVSGETVQVYSRPPEGDEALVATLSSGDGGHFDYALDAKASQSLRFVYGGTATRLPAEDEVALLVTGRSTFTVNRQRVLNGQSVVFSGRVQGRPLPEAGKLIELQVRLSDEWSTFRTIRSEADGSWRLPYPFERTCGLQHFRFRAALPGEASYPLEPGHSPVLAITVKGQPCSAG